MLLIVVSVLAFAKVAVTQAAEVNTYIGCQTAGGIAGTVYVSSPIPPGTSWCEPLPWITGLLNSEDLVPISPTPVINYFNKVFPPKAMNGATQ